MNSSSRRAAGVLFVLANAAVYLFLKPIYLNPDGIGYFSYLPAIFVQHTLSFLYSYKAYPIDLPVGRTSTGWVLNYWAFGSSFFWLPFYKAGRLYMRLQGFRASAPWGSFYLGMVNVGNMLLCFGAAALLYERLPRMLRLRYRLGIVLAAFFGTPLFFYGFLTGAMSHAASAFASGLFLWYWWDTADTPEPGIGRWFLLGLLAGIATMVRTQEGLILLAPGIEWLRRKNWRMASPLALGFLIGFSPQMTLWKILFGSVLYSPETFNLSGNQFHLVRCLFSPFHGLFPWTPLYGLSLLGLAVAWRKGNWKAAPLLGIVLLQVGVYSFSSTWWFDFSFGLRQITGTFLIAGLGLSALLADCRDRQPLIVGALLFCALWTLFLALNAYVHTIDLGAPLSLAALGHAVMKSPTLLPQVWHKFSSIGHPPAGVFLLVLVLEGVSGVWFYLVLRWPARTLSVTLLPWLTFVWVRIIEASHAPHPDWSTENSLTETQVGNYFVAQSLQNQALWYVHHDDLSEALRCVDEARQILPHAPQTIRVEGELSLLRKEISDAGNPGKM